MLLMEIKKSDKLLDYHDKLSPKIWVNMQLKREVLDALRAISAEFLETLQVPKNSVKDIIITGSLCNYNYTKYSDVDLHVVLDYSEICDGCPAFNLDDCMKAKKSLWNDRHDITIYGMDVELYAQDIKDHITGNAGVYSIMRDAWVKKPVRDNVVYDERLIMDKAKHIMYEIDSFVDDASNDFDGIQKLKDKIKNMRKSGLEKGGEFSVENLVFKVLRNSGYMEKLYDYEIDKKDEELSLK